MATPSTDYYASFDITDGSQELDVSRILLAALNNAPGVLNTIPVGEAAQDTICYWTEESLNPYQITTTASIFTAGVTTFTFASGQGTRLRVGSLLSSRVANVNERILVTAITGDVATVTRGYGGSTAASVNTTSTLDIIGNPLQEASDIQADVTRSQTVNSNVTQIFERSIKVSRNQQNRRMYSVPDMLMHSLENRTIEVKRELNLAVINGIAPASTAIGSDSVLRTMNGLHAYLDGASNANSTSETITPTVVNALVKSIVDTGHIGDNLVLLTGHTQRQKISAFDASIRIRTEDSSKAGQYIESIRTDLGVELPVVTDNFIKPDVAFIIDKTRCAVRPFVGSAWMVKAAPTLADGVQRRVLGEWTLEVRNPNEAHAVHSNLST